MCALCGVFLSEAHWTDTSPSPPGQSVRTRRHERLHRVALANRILKHYGLKLGDWQGNAYLLSAATGQTAVLANVAAVWPAAERLRKRALDPLDPKLIEALERS